MQEYGPQISRSNGYDPDVSWASSRASNVRKEGKQSGSASRRAQSLPGGSGAAPEQAPDRHGAGDVGGYSRRRHDICLSLIS
jgi:hypothetical protein